MIRFFLALLASLAAVYLTAVVVTAQEDRLDGAMLGAAWTLIAAPFLGAYAAVELVAMVRRPRCFDARAAMPWWNGAMGVAAGLGAAAIGTIVMAFRPDAVPEWAAFMAGGVCAGLLITLCQRRVKPGVCVRCAYDLRATPSAVCPECGGRETA